MSKRVLAVDFDDVLLPFDEGFIAYHNTNFGTEVRHEHSVEYASHTLFGIDRRTKLDRVNEFCASDAHANLVPVKGSFTAVQSLRQQFDLQIVTSRPERAADSVHNWLGRNFPDCFSRVHFMNHVDPHEGAVVRAKGEVCRELDVIGLIEDAPTNALNAANLGVQVYLFDRFWNQEVAPHQNITRVHSWEEIVDWLCSRT